MTNEKRLEELSEIAITVIKEVTKEMAFMGWEDIEEIKYDKEKKMIFIQYETETQEYELDDIASILSSLIDGFGPCCGEFEEEIYSIECELKEKYGEIEKEKMTYDTIVMKTEIQEKRKKEFKEYAGRVSYVKYRAPEVLEILRFVEEEARKLMPREQGLGFQTNLGILLEDVTFRDKE
ncbi:MAG: hypothetical protein ACRC28_18930 [Clostridium sp.]|uniref:hypothetical protein n=1 Tax=Clostridium sp. TaxID=1506 RepID=UPI003F2F5897